MQTHTRLYRRNSARRLSTCCGCSEPKFFRFCRSVAAPQSVSASIMFSSTAGVLGVVRVLALFGLLAVGKVCHNLRVLTNIAITFVAGDQPCQRRCVIGCAVERAAVQFLGAAGAVSGLFSCFLVSCFLSQPVLSPRAHCRSGATLCPLTTSSAR